MDYYYKKYVESIIYDVDIFSKIKKIYKLDEKFLEQLEKYITQYESTIDVILKKRILDIIFYLRSDLEYNKDESANKYINRIITKLNNFYYQNTLDFYYHQAVVRAHDTSKTTHNEKMERIFELHDAICMSISYDYEIMKDLSLPTKSFDLIYSKYISNGWFLCSVKGIYAENKDFFTNPNVISNLKKIILANDEIKLKNNLYQSSKDIKILILKNRE